MSKRRRLEFLGDGCADHSCLINPQLGQGTNGRCRCNFVRIKHAFQKARAKVIELADANGEHLARAFKVAHVLVEMRKALLRYGAHEAGCKYGLISAADGEPCPCTCGFLEWSRIRD